MGKARDILRQRVWLAGFGLNQGLGLVFTGKEKGSRGEGEKGRNDSFVSAGEPMPARPSGRAVRRSIARRAAAASARVEPNSYVRSPSPLLPFSFSKDKQQHLDQTLRPGGGLVNP